MKFILNNIEIKITYRNINNKSPVENSKLNP